jgi:DNA-binding IclR family transcriptional regulator
LLPFATDLAIKLRTPTNISFYGDRHAVITDSIALQAEIAVAFAEGIRIPAACIGPGKVLLASQPAEEIERILLRPMAQFTERTITEPAEIRAELELTKQRGYRAPFFSS